MAYITGTITDANPGPALYALMAPALTTAGYTLVDTVTISTRTHKIWKSAAANNSLSLDWYLDIGYPTTGAGALVMAPFEYFDPATDLGYRGLVSINQTTIDATTFSRYGATGSALETNWITAPATYTSYQLPLIATSFGYWISVTPERVIMLLSNSPTIVYFSGFYVPDSLYAAKAGASLFPLMGAVMTPTTTAALTSGTTTTTAALTRVPPATSLASPGWNTTLHIQGLKQEEYGSYPQIPTGSQQVYPWVAAPLSMFVSLSNQALFARYGTVRDVLTAAASGSLVRGDTCTIGGEQYVFTSPSSAGALLFRAA